ncbi:hypothetical protein AGABI2DRAFT_191422 [Agaricus bisporus var. bisporus H97]|uniref:hypothetical protein n=1 Tax=Agaricus bisporus var. bisporus (strain H97 / ATCC MYA-4626 / FGSC 10389) TaxID=936046 RepID=UPI00029F7197|nr:hypothetical protein AGABI2DRAFT_191422 [Agaricus bisporus var. bisporus H97]EKV49375.1 hypothetical protein AGABI2DRAFT_191422 [Agaricus bisporus var. bisporus H97]
MAKRINATRDVRKDDTIIAFMGPTGAGKSFFIDLLTGASDQDRRAGSTLRSVTSQIEATTVVHPSDKDRRVVLVDTPGFDDTTRSDMQILQMISEWLQSMYKADVKLSGLIYLHRITDNRMAGSPYKNLRMFGELCGDVAMNQVFLVSTMWGKIKPEIGEAREQELKDRFWEPLIKKGSSVERLSKTKSDEAWRIVNKLIEIHDKKLKKEIVLLQEEMVDLGIKLNETQAGKTLYTSLQKQLVDQKDALKSLLTQVEKSNDRELTKELKKEYDKIEADFQKTFEEAKKFKVSIGTKIVGIFGGKKAKAKAVKIGDA